MLSDDIMTPSLFFFRRRRRPLRFAFCVLRAEKERKREREREKERYKNGLVCIFSFLFFFFLKTGGSESSPLVFAFCVYIRKTGVLAFFFSLLPHNALSETVRDRERRRRRAIFSNGNMRTGRRPRSRRGGIGKNTENAARSSRHREKIFYPRRSPPNEKKGKNDDDDDDDQKKAGNSKGIAKRTARRRIQRMMDGSNNISIVGEREEVADARRWR